MPSITNQHIDKYLTEMSVGIGYPEFIADKLAPPIYVPKRSDKFRIYGKEFIQIPAGKGYTADGTLTPGLTYALSNDTYYCTQYGFHEKLPHEILAQSDSGPEALRLNSLFITKQVTETIRENLVATALQLTGNYSGAGTLNIDNVGTTVTAWNHASSTTNPLVQFNTLRSNIRAKSGVMPNVAWFAYDSWAAFILNPFVIDRIKYTGRDAVTEEIAAKLLNVDEVVIGGAIQSVTNPGQTAAITDIWTNTAGMLYRYPSPSNNIAAPTSVPRAFSQFIWTAPELGAAADGSIVYNWVQQNEGYAEYVEYRKNFTIKQTFAGAAGIIRHTVSS